MNLHFGHAKEFMVYETDGEIVSFLGIRKVQAYCQGRANCNGDKAATLREIIAGLSDCSALFSAGIGKVPEAKLRAAGIIPVVKPGAVEELLLEHAKYERYLLSPLPGETGRQRAGS